LPSAAATQCSSFVLDKTATPHYIAYRDDWHEPPAISGGRARQKQRNSALFRPLLFRCFRAVMPAVLSLFLAEKV
jgi:hypothetical protein